MSRVNTQRNLRTTTRTEANASRANEPRVKKQEKENCQVGPPLLSVQSHARTLESLETSVNPSWIVIERCESDRHIRGAVPTATMIYISVDRTVSLLDFALSNPSTTVI